MVVLLMLLSCDVIIFHSQQMLLFLCYIFPLFYHLCYHVMLSCDVIM
jgi:hypothetical protein